MIYTGLVPEAGLEPARHCWQGILNPSCLPISSLRHRRVWIEQAGYSNHSTVKGKYLLISRSG